MISSVLACEFSFKWYSFLIGDEEKSDEGIWLASNSNIREGKSSKVCESPGHQGGDNEENRYRKFAENIYI